MISLTLLYMDYSWGVLFNTDILPGKNQKISISGCLFIKNYIFQTITEDYSSLIYPK